MILIYFYIIFKNQLEIDSIKLLQDCEFQQLKLMICGKYKIYDLNNIYIYYKDNLITDNDSTKLKDIFKNKKVKLEISETPMKKVNLSPITITYFCSCESKATSICDKCNEFLCESCTKKKNHNSHMNKIVKISEYKKYFKSNINNISEELEKNILNDEPYLFFQFWNYDINSELAKIDGTFEFVKKELEDIKKILIDYILSFGEYNNYEKLKEQMDLIIKQYMNINLDNDYKLILEEKKKINQLLKKTYTWYDQLKNQLFNYNKAIKDIQIFNQLLIKETKDKFILIQKNYEQVPTIQNSLSNGNISEITNNNFNDDFILINGKNSNNISNKNKKQEQNQNNTKYNQNNNYLDDSFHSLYEKKNIIHKTVNNIFNNNSSIINTGNFEEKLLFNLKDKQKMIIFSLKNQTFKEKNFIDKSNFSKEIKENSDIIQLNHDNKLYILSGRNNNKLYYYDYESNTLNYLCNTIFEHYYGAMVYCQKNNMIYIIGGENQKKCEIANLNINSNLDLKVIPSLNEERQKFASMYFNEYIYVFFGYSIKKGNNLSSIERINVNTNSKFDIVYLNEQITLCSLACTEIIDEDENNEIILLLGGYDGRNFLDTSLILDVKEMKIRDWDIIIPNMNRHNQFLFHKESTFVDYDPNIKLIYDMKNNVHLISKDSYELFSEIQ